MNGAKKLLILLEYIFFPEKTLQLEKMLQTFHTVY